LNRLGGPPSIRPLLAAHLVTIVAGGWVNVALADSLFFSVDAGASRHRVLVYLVLTLLPVAAMIHVVGPCVDRSAKRPSLIAAQSSLLRAAACVGLAFTMHSSLLFVFAVSLLIGNKIHTASKYVMVPSLVDDAQALVGVNVLFAKWGAVAGGLGLSSAIALRSSLGGAGLLVVAALVFALAAGGLLRFEVLRAPVAAPTVGQEASPRARRAAHLLVLLRFSVGAFAFATLFMFRGEDAPTTMLALAGGAYAAGSFTGNLAAPLARRVMAEPSMLRLGCIGVCITASLSAIVAVPALSVVAALTLGIGSALGRQAFDSMVQTDHPLGRRGRVHARFEVAAHVGWVAGASGAIITGIDLGEANAVIALLLFVALCAGRLDGRVTHSSSLHNTTSTAGPYSPADDPVTLRPNRGNWAGDRRGDHRLLRRVCSRRAPLAVRLMFCLSSSVHRAVNR